RSCWALQRLLKPARRTPCSEGRRVAPRHPGEAQGGWTAADRAAPRHRLRLLPIGPAGGQGGSGPVTRAARARARDTGKFSGMSPHPQCGAPIHAQTMRGRSGKVTAAGATFGGFGPPPVSGRGGSVTAEEFAEFYQRVEPEALAVARSELR